MTNNSVISILVNQFGLCSSILIEGEFLKRSLQDRKTWIDTISIDIGVELYINVHQLNYQGKEHGLGCVNVLCPKSAPMQLHVQ